MPKWLNDAVFYEIYPQSFNDTNSDGIGDLNGIIQKLDYIKDLGCTDIWLNPCFDSPFNDAGYDVRDYYLIAPRYGTNDDMKRLFDEAHRRGMHVLLDFVPGHTSIDCEWFKESMKADKNEYSDRYIWTDATWIKPAGMGYISGISERYGCAAINFFSCQPALNYGYAVVTESYQMPPDHEAPMATRKAMSDVMKFWLDMGCDGFRVDMAFSLIKADADGSANIKLWQEMLSYFRKNYPDAAFVSEWGEPQKAVAGGFDLDFLLHFGPSGYLSLCRDENPYFSYDGNGNIDEFVKNYKKCYESVKGNGFIAFPTGNHDMPRMSLKCDEHMMQLVNAFIFTMPSVPFLYYGDEIGMRYIEGLKSVEGGYLRTGARTPMQWDNSKNAGFSNASSDDLYIQIDPSDDRPTVEDQISDENSLLNATKKIIKFRKKHKALGTQGDFEFISHMYPLIYRRWCDDESIIAVINPSDKEIIMSVNFDGESIYSIGEKSHISSGKLHVMARSATFFKEIVTL